MNMPADCSLGMNVLHHGGIWKKEIGMGILHTLVAIITIKIEHSIYINSSFIPRLGSINHMQRGKEKIGRKP
jgi:hypothetical protein